MLEIIKKKCLLYVNFTWETGKISKIASETLDKVVRDSKWNSNVKNNINVFFAVVISKNISNVPNLFSFFYIVCLSRCKSNDIYLYLINICRKQSLYYFNPIKNIRKPRRLI